MAVLYAIFDSGWHTVMMNFYDESLRTPHYKVMELEDRHPEWQTVIATYYNIHVTI